MSHINAVGILILPVNFSWPLRNDTKKYNTITQIMSLMVGMSGTSWGLLLCLAKGLLLESLCATLGVLVTQLWPTLSNPMDYSLHGSSVHGPLQARTLGWVTIPFSRRSSQHRDRTWITSTAGRFFTVWAISEATLSSLPKSRWGTACLLTSLSSVFFFFCCNSTMKWLGLCHVFPLSHSLPSFLLQTVFILPLFSIPFMFLFFPSLPHKLCFLPHQFHSIHTQFSAPPYSVLSYQCHLLDLLKLHAKILCVCVCAQSCPNLCDPMDCSLPVSLVHGILQARILEWVAISFSRGSSQSRYWTWVSCVSCIAGRFFIHWLMVKAPLKVRVLDVF